MMRRRYKVCCLLTEEVAFQWPLPAGRAGRGPVFAAQLDSETGIEDQNMKYRRVNNSNNKQHKSGSFLPQRDPTVTPVHRYMLMQTSFEVLQKIGRNHRTAWVGLH